MNLEVYSGKAIAKRPKSIHHGILAGVARAVMQIGFRHGGVGGAA
jgi:hypothetical protein